MITVLIAVITLDGCITRHDQPGAQGWASAEDQAHFRSSTAKCDVRIFGSGTYLPDRDAFCQSSRPGVRRVVLTSDPLQFGDDAVAGQLEFTSETPSSLIARLRSEGHTRCAVLGGGRVYGSFLAADLIDEIELTVEPLVFGTGVRLAGDQPIDQRFTLTSMDKINDSTLLLRYGRA
jgi:dihydrofolate reductase